MIPDEVQCREVVNVLTDYLDGALPAEQRAALEQHLLTCEGCTNYVDQMRTSIGLTGRLQEEDVPQAVMDKVLQMFQDRLPS
ncbi:zf-HC2 domain-containing protein [Nocardioides sp. WL0053]|uniref:Zf-HC2 domain-containing protein n=1 Tax=Nocardioides jiangsuensis TaxID=2866161 RepID=A0ABS7RNE4_9ACTN|nr:zf-HC2 domain-containing protein [Nocardioides jiangsuensis]MBY9076579.1 zf-HC2 domain-containing protein [Nocardioides jiangsuensis]